MSPSITHTTAAGEVSLSSLIISSRVREDIPSVREYISSRLAPSIAARGLIQPIIVKSHDLPIEGVNAYGDQCKSHYELVAGWCRTQAFVLLGHTSIPYCFRSDLPEHELRALELEENTARLEMTWQDRVLAMSEIYRLKKLAHADDAEHYGFRQAGDELNVAAGYINEMVTIAKLIRAGDKDVIACDSVYSVRKLMALRKEDAIQSRLQAITRDAITKVKKQISTPFNNFNTTHKPLPLPSGSKSEPLKNKVGDEKHRVELSSMLYNMDCHEWFDKAQAECIDLVYTDIPFGINMEDLAEMGNIDRVRFEHDVDENLSQMPRFLAGAYKVLKDKSYLLFWYDLAHHEKLLQWAEDVGFSVEPYPLMWLKTHGCKNKAAHCWFTKATEYVMVCRKGTATLKHPMNVNYFAASGDAERKMQANPFSKPFAFSQWALEPILHPGMTVLDCYAGEGSLLRAVLNLGGRIIGVEKSELHFPRLEEHVRNFFKETFNNNVEFV